MTRTATKSQANGVSAAGYERVDLTKLEPPLTQEPVGRGAAYAPAIRWTIIPLSALLCVGQAVATILAFEMRAMPLTATLIPILAFVLLLVTALVVNPFLRVVAALLGQWARPLNRMELVCLFSAMLVTSGISTIGLSDPLIPLVAAPYNPEWNTPARGWNDALVPRLNPKLYIQDRQAIAIFRQGVTLYDAQGHAIILSPDSATWSQKLDYGWRVFQAVPWMLWLRPLAYWLIFIGSCYGIFYCLTYIVLSHWAEKEKLIFPLVRLYESVMPERNSGRYRLPALLRSPGFWYGFALSFLILAWNADVTDGWLKNKGFSAIALGLWPWPTQAAFQGSIFQGLAPGWGLESFCFMIDFIALGIAFFLPLEVSFSIWFYYLIGRFILLLHIWAGYGDNILAFPSDYLNQTNADTSLGGGGMFVYGAICLFRCIRDYARLVAGKSVAQRILVGLPVVGLLGFTLVTIAWLRWNRIPIEWAAVFVACFTLLTIGLMRVVAESGIYWFQTYTGFFHLYRVLGLGKFLAPVVMAPLMPFYSVLFLDNKTFLAPNLLNAAEMQRNSRATRWKFHLNLLLCIALSVGVSLPFSIYLAHLRGAQNMEDWFYNLSSAWMLDTAKSVIDRIPQFNLTQTLWYIAGGLWVALSVILRTRFFWFPHPVGMVMLMNRMIAFLWFSFFLGWVCKWLVVHYGGKKTYERLRNTFIGLIAGQLSAILFWTVIALLANMVITEQTLTQW